MSAKEGRKSGFPIHVKNVVTQRVQNDSPLREPSPSVAFSTVYRLFSTCYMRVRDWYGSRSRLSDLTFSMGKDQKEKTKT